METQKFLDLDCVLLENEFLSLLVTRSVGPRVISLRYLEGENLFAELPDIEIQHPDGEIFRLYGGHRLWQAPESMALTYSPDNSPVEINYSSGSLTAIQPVDPRTGLEKSIRISLKKDEAGAVIEHSLTNKAARSVECAPWAITQLKVGGVAILPQAQAQSGLLPNRLVALWPYTDVTNPLVSWGNEFILARAAMESGASKLGFPNPRGWLGYWLAGTLFVKKAAFDPQAAYYDLGSSSECYLCDRFLELETLGPIGILEPGGSLTHVETWEVYGGIEEPADEAAARRVANLLGLE